MRLTWRDPVFLVSSIIIAICLGGAIGIEIYIRSLEKGMAVPMKKRRVSTGKKSPKKSGPFPFPPRSGSESVKSTGIFAAPESVSCPRPETRTNPFQASADQTDNPAQPQSSNILNEVNAGSSESKMKNQGIVLKTKSSEILKDQVSVEVEAAPAAAVFEAPIEEKILIPQSQAQPINNSNMEVEGGESEAESESESEADTESLSISSDNEELGDEEEISVDGPAASHVVAADRDASSPPPMQLKVSPSTEIVDSVNVQSEASSSAAFVASEDEFSSPAPLEIRSNVSSPVFEQLEEIASNSNAEPDSAKSYVPLLTVVSSDVQSESSSPSTPSHDFHAPPNSEESDLDASDFDFDSEVLDFGSSEISSDQIGLFRIGFRILEDSDSVRFGDESPIMAGSSVAGDSDWDDSAYLLECDFDAEKRIKSDPAPEPSPSSASASASDRSQSSEVLAASEYVESEVNREIDVDDSYSAASVRPWPVKGVMSILDEEDDELLSDVGSNQQRNIDAVASALNSESGSFASSSASAQAQSKVLAPTSASASDSLSLSFASAPNSAFGSVQDYKDSHDKPGYQTLGVPGDATTKSSHPTLRIVQVIKEDAAKRSDLSSCVIPEDSSSLCAEDTIQKLSHSSGDGAGAEPDLVQVEDEANSPSSRLDRFGVIANSSGEDSSCSFYSSRAAFGGY